MRGMAAGLRACGHGHVLRTIELMRLSEFRRLMDEEFGPANAGVIASSLVLPTLDTTADQALDAGADPRRVWLDVCDLQGVPEDRRLGRDIPPKE